MIKRARFIEKNMDLLQEFAYATADSKMILSAIYTYDFYGAMV